MQVEAREAPGNAGMHPVDLEVLLDLLGNPGSVEKARAVFERGIVRGLLGEMEVSLPSWPHPIQMTIESLKAAMCR